MSKLFDDLKRDSNLLDWKRKYYIFWQIIARMESEDVKANSDVESAIWETYMSIYELFKKDFNWELPPEVNNTNDQTYIFTDEYIDDKEPNSKKVLAAAKSETDKNRKVLIVNTAEKLGGEAVALHDRIEARYKTELENVDNVFWENRSFTYFQFPKNMPDVNYYKVFLDSIVDSIPGKMVITSKYSLLADYCKEKLGIPVEIVD